jgi:hypothetical protein
MTRYERRRHLTVSFAFFAAAIVWALLMSALQRL